MTTKWIALPLFVGLAGSATAYGQSSSNSEAGVGDIQPLVAYCAEHPYGCDGLAQIVQTYSPVNAWVAPMVSKFVECTRGITGVSSAPPPQWCCDFLHQTRDWAGQIGSASGALGKTSIAKLAIIIGVISQAAAIRCRP